MDQVLEHVVDPLKTLKEIHGILKPGGKLMVAVPNPSAFGRRFFGRYWGGWHLPFHRHFFSRHSINVLAKNAGYGVVLMKSATESVNLLHNWVRLFVLGAKGKAAPRYSQGFGKDSEIRVMNPEMKKRFAVRLYLFIRKIRLFSLPMRIADLLGLGDNNLIILERR
jgi:SAM-dependent methyltransferase